MKPINDTDLEQLSAYIDGELSDSERRFFQKRLANDAELRAFCERAWIASTVLKAQPFQLMPANSSEQICTRCTEPVSRFNMPLRLVAAFATLALVTGLGYQLMKPSEQSQTVVLQPPPPVSSDMQAAPVQSVAQNTARPEISQSAVAPSAPINESANSQIVNQDNPAQFALNEATRSKSWPKSNQAMDEYLTRHNQMIGASASNGLVSYAQIIAEPEPSEPSQAAQDQDQ